MIAARSMSNTFSPHVDVRNGVENRRSLLCEFPQFGKLLRAENLTVAFEDFDFEFVVGKELHFPPLSGNAYLNHDSTLPN
jgi:hypothetical protein